ncbi:hypothetical protein Tsubulata_015205 [Turnera subulata]|uniref:Uncharacterized protein n=1 Tax=Turnera subulata TaxID=218843 RepID=A0A9Q0F949_9ROSI|nr:hypothetical protein Tsubulata_015205 [Turnera subulata]
MGESSPLVDSRYVEDYEETVTSSACGCFQGLCSGLRRSYTHKQLVHNQDQEVKEDGWFVEKVKELREISELLAGPRWKNFIRRFSVRGCYKKRSRMQCHYDPQSYALNFDDGIEREANVAYPDFLARYAASVQMNKVDLGRT